jgi:hypothetical protein
VNRKQRATRLVGAPSGGPLSFSRLPEPRIEEHGRQALRVFRSTRRLMVRPRGSSPELIGPNLSGIGLENPATLLGLADEVIE